MAISSSQAKQTQPKATPAKQKGPAQNGKNSAQSTPAPKQVRRFSQTRLLWNIYEVYQSTDEGLISSGLI